MPGKPFVSPVDVHVSAANAPSDSSDGSVSKAPPKKKPRAGKTTKTTKKSGSKAVEASLPALYGTFRCLVCDYSQVVLPGSPRPQSGWRCPYDFSNLVWASANLAPLEVA